MVMMVMMVRLEAINDSFDMLCEHLALAQNGKKKNPNRESRITNGSFELVNSFGSAESQIPPVSTHHVSRINCSNVTFVFRTVKIFTILDTLSRQRRFGSS